MLIIGHRGAKGEEPENTLRAVRAGMACAESVEVDVRLSLDGVPVVMHDPLLDRTTNGTGPVNEYTKETLQTLDAGEGEKIPTLEEVCSLVAGHCGLFLEIKEPGSEEQVCRAGPRSESRLRSRQRICRTQAEWDALDRARSRSGAN